ncbi:hypothetical protein ACFLZZ_00115 [Nanoarchaeota archaeon]
MQEEQKSKVKQVILSIAIALVLVFFIGYGISVIYEEPDYEDYCGDYFDKPSYNDQVSCEEVGGKWTAPTTVPQPVREESFEGGPVIMPTETQGRCDSDFTCRKEHRSASDVYNRNVFATSLILGMIIIVLGIVLQLESVSVGIMGGGVMLIIYGTMRYWGELGKYFRLLILGLVLVALIWIGYKKFGSD